jgi:hypothetical protein
MGKLVTVARGNMTGISLRHYAAGSFRRPGSSV